MTGRYRNTQALRAEYEEKRDAIAARLAEFQRIGHGDERRLFEELCFCLLAIQSKARSADSAVRGLSRGGLLWKGRTGDIASYLRHRTRFHNHKATYIVRARDRFFSGEGPSLENLLDSFAWASDARAWLAHEVHGLGLKEASHFLRNVGRGEALAILDRHVLRNLAWHGVLGPSGGSLTPRRYFVFEDRMARFADDVGIPMGVLDLLFWSRETGEIFK